MRMFFDGTIEELTAAAAIVGGLLCRDDNQYQLQGGAIMFTVKANRPDEPYEIILPTLKSEGKVIPTTPADFDWTIESSNPSAVELVADSDENPLTGNVHFGTAQDDGTPALSSVNVMGVHRDSGLAFSFGAQFTVTAGDPDEVSGGTISFPNLTEDEGPAPNP